VNQRVALYLQDAHDLRDGLDYVRYAEQRGFAFLLALSQGFFMRLFGTIASSSTIALQFTADGRFVYTEYVGNFCLV